MERDKDISVDSDKSSMAHFFQGLATSARRVGGVYLTVSFCESIVHRYCMPLDFLYSLLYVLYYE